MAGSVNKVTLIGNIGKDPEIRSTQNGDKIANLVLATSDYWKDKQTGERKERTEWHKVVVFNDHLVGIIERYVNKGTKIYVEGALQTRKWTDNNGMDKYTTEVVLQRFKGDLTLLDSRGGNSGGGYDNNNSFNGNAGGNQQMGQQQGNNFNNNNNFNSDGPDPSAGLGGPDIDLDDEIPF